MFWISAAAPAGLASDHFWQTRPNLAVAKFLAEFLDLAECNASSFGCLLKIC